MTEELGLATLSICIPTFNREKCLGELLDSIVAQRVPEIEVIVSDDASSDHTADVVATYAAKLANLKYVRQETNIGLDLNFLVVVEHATSDYVWFMGDDDRLEKGAVQNVLAALAAWPGIVGMTIGVIDYDHEFRAPTGVRHMPPTARVSGTEAVFSEIVDLLGFMSALVINRHMWKVVRREDPISAYQNLYLQVYILGRALDRFGDWGILNTPCVGFRSSNDQFLSKFGWLKRMQMDVLAYEQIASGLFPRNERARRAMRQRIFVTHVIARLRNAKTAHGPTPQIWEAIKFLYSHYRTVLAFWTYGLPTLLMPKRLLRRARALYQRYSSSSGARRAKRLSI
ncbi:MAG: glycosyltransferase family 2 protein [Pseudomonadota bacterium]